LVVVFKLLAITNIVVVVITITIYNIQYTITITITKANRIEETISET
jgi:hypothetical protein